MNYGLSGYFYSWLSSLNFKIGSTFLGVKQEKKVLVDSLKPGDVPVLVCHGNLRISPWGELLWESQELDGEQPGSYWDGMYKGAFAPQGAYAWKASITFINGLKQVKMGSVILLR